MLSLQAATRISLLKILGAYRHKQKTKSTPPKLRTKPDTVVSITETDAFESNGVFDRDEIPIRLSKRVLIKSKHFNRVKVFCDHSGMKTVRPHWCTQHCDAVLEANGVAEIRKGIQLDFWMSKFGSNDVNFPKNMRVNRRSPTKLHS